MTGLPQRKIVLDCDSLPLPGDATRSDYLLFAVEQSGVQWAPAVKIKVAG